jgi:hypothetical protein
VPTGARGDAGPIGRRIIIHAMTAVAGPRAWCDGDATYTMVPSLTTARMRRADVNLGVEEMRTVDSSDITKSVQEPTIIDPLRGLRPTFIAPEPTVLILGSHLVKLTKGMVYQTAS